MTTDLHSIRAETETAIAVTNDHEEINEQFKVILSCLGDATVATLSLLNLNLDARGITFAGDVIDAVRRAMHALEAASEAQSRQMVAQAERIRELTLKLQAEGGRTL